MATIKILRTGLIGEEDHRDIPVARPPRAWDMADAKIFLHTMQAESATADCPLRHVECIRIHEFGRPDVIAIEVVTNAGIVMTEPMRISSLALTWLDEVQFDSRPHMVPAAPPRKRVKRPVAQ